MPVWLALIVQVPPESRVTFPPETVQTPVVVEAKLTARPELAVALTVNDPERIEYEVSPGLNVMVCDAWLIVKFTGTGVAAL